MFQSYQISPKEKEGKYRIDKRIDRWELKNYCTCCKYSRLSPLYDIKKNELPYHLRLFSIALCQNKGALKVVISYEKICMIRAIHVFGHRRIQFSFIDIYFISLPSYSLYKYLGSKGQIFTCPRKFASNWFVKPLVTNQCCF